MLKKRATVYAVASEAGVSAATVSYVINGKKAAQSISQKTKDKVMAAAIKLEYVPNYSARILRYKHSNLIGVVIPQTEPGKEFMFSNPFYGDFLSAVEYTARINGFRLLISGTCVGQSYAEIAQNHTLDAIIILGMYPTDEIENYKQSKIPVVLVDCYCNDHVFHRVGTNDRHGGYLATKYLVDNGHKKIAFVSGSIATEGVSKHRMLGYEDALAEANIKNEAERLFTGNVGYEYGIEVAKQIVDNCPDVTAVFSTADIMAAGLIKGFTQLGKKVPEEISIVGFDDIFVSNLCTPSLTTVRQNIKDKGKAAAELALAAINSEEQIKKEIVIPLEIVERDSVKNMNER